MRRYAFVGGTVIDGTGRDPVHDGVVLVDSGRIAAIGRRAEFGGAVEAQEINCTGWTVLPGLINSHVHVGLVGDRNRLPAMARMKDRELFPIYAENARVNLDHGVTSVRDLHPGPGGTVEIMKVLQEAISRGFVTGSRMFVALRPLVQPGGHGTQWLSRQVSGIDEVRRGVRENVAEGSDFIKIMTAASWGPLPDDPESHARYHTIEELRAAVDTAHRAGRVVSAHAHGEDAIRDDLEAGIDCIEHGSGLTDDLIERMVRQGTWLVPTLASYENFLRHGASRSVSPKRLDEARYLIERHQPGVAKAIAAGVKIAAGTDSGFHLLTHGDCLVLELELYVRFGMRPLDAIHAATSRGAELLQQADRLGTLEPGKVADVIAVDGDPLADISRLRNVRVVMQQGVVHTPSTAAAKTADPA